MKAGGIESIRWPLPWSAIQPTEKGGYDWGGFDEVVGDRDPARAPGAALHLRHPALDRPQVHDAAGQQRQGALGLDRLPRGGGRTLRPRRRILDAAPTGGVGPGPTYQPEPAVPAVPIRSWQIWNEANFFYFAYPASPQRYAKLLQISSPAIKAVDPGAKVILTGLFGEPTAHGAKGMPAAKFLEVLYRTPGIKSRFDGIALHPYAVDAETLEELVEGLHEVTVENHDRVPLYITEMGWGSQNDFQQVAFEQGIRGQVKQLRGLLRLPAGKPQPPRPQAGLLVLLEGPARTPAASATRSASSAPAPSASSRSRPGTPSSASPAGGRGPSGPFVSPPIWAGGGWSGRGRLVAVAPAVRDPDRQSRDFPAAIAPRLVSDGGEGRAAVDLRHEAGGAGTAEEPRAVASGRCAAASPSRPCGRRRGRRRR